MKSGVEQLQSVNVCSIERVIQSVWHDCVSLHTAILCDPLTLGNGTTHYSPDTESPFEFGTVASQECDEGFSLSGSGTRTCGENGISTVGEWTGEPASCAGKLQKCSRWLYLLR